ncbi:DUF3572 domain-containing protein [Altererythrobacter sp. MTPC7]|uniref:DUF3572 domain-containing protein n=1 Tax=Altererythrobacter sp. MTPC7 TaxID=3056567 RepID=UPI0036F42809
MTAGAQHVAEQLAIEVVVLDNEDTLCHWSGLLLRRSRTRRTERHLTIIRQSKSPASAQAAETLALGALGWVLTDHDRAGRLLALTGLTPDILRERLAERQVQAAVLEFLAQHEPDLVGAAEALGVEPQDLITAHRTLAGAQTFD